MNILLFTNNIASAKAEIERLRGRVIHQFGTTAFIADVSDSFDARTLQHSSTQRPSTLDPTVGLAVDAWGENASSPERAPSPTDGLPWDSPGFKPPLYLENDDEPSPSPRGPEEEPERSTDTPTSLYMTESITVGLVMVAGKSDALKISDDDQKTIVRQALRGLDWLTRQEPRAHITFVYDIKVVTVDAKPGPDSTVKNNFEKYERGWRDAALTSLGYANGRGGYRKYVEDLRKSL